MSRQQRRSTHSVSLFPFLAVLVCAMGALIFLLIVTTRQIRSEAISRAQEARKQQAGPAPQGPAPPIESLPSPPSAELALADQEPPVAAPPAPADPDAGLRETIQRLSARRDAQARALAERRALVSSARQMASDLAARAAEHAQRLEEAQRETDGHRRSVRDLQAEQAQLAERLLRLREQIGARQRQQVEASSKYTIVPYEGRSGTTRRPILIEFTEEGVRFLAEDVLLTLEDFYGFTPGYNPLLAGARALVDYWSARSREADEPEPYVLLIVRPGGVANYPIRQFLEALGHPVGYELLEEDQELQRPESDPEAAAACRRAVDRMLQERRQVIESLAEARGGGAGGRPGGAGRRPSLRVRRTATGFEVEEVEPDPLGRGVLSGPEARGLEAGRRGPGAGGGSTPGSQAGAAPAGRGLAGAGGREPDDRFGSGGGSDGAGFGRSGDGQDFRNQDLRAQDLRAQNLRNLRPGAAGSLQPTDEGLEAPDSESAVARGSEDQRGEREPGAGGGAPRALYPPQSPLDGDVASRRSSGSAEEGEFDPSRREPSEPDGAASARRRADNSPTMGKGGGPPSRFPTFGPPSRPLSFERDRPRARRWGLSDPRATIGFEREVVVESWPDRLQVRGLDPIPVGRGESRDEVMEDLLADVEKKALEWGRPPDNFYWVPNLKFQVAPGGNQHYERLKGPLAEWGLNSSVEHRLEAGGR